MLRDDSASPSSAANRFARHDLDRQVELLHHAAHELQLLAVLLAEHGVVGLHQIEELQHDRAYAVEKARTERAVELVADRRRLHAVDLRRRIHVVLVRREQYVDPFALELRTVGFERSRVAIEVLVRTELQPVDEDARDDTVGVTLARSCISDR